jgi:hypothetical protein
MKRTHVVLWIALGLPAFLLAGCTGKEIASSNSAGSTPAASHPVSATANSPAISNQSPSSPAATEPAKLIGVYEAREVENKGVVTLISHIKTVFSFTPDGTYSRVSQIKGKTYHSDGGRFRIEPPDKLVLEIQIADRNMQSPSITKELRFSLSPDGDELKITSAKGTATYQRIAKRKDS